MTSPHTRALLSALALLLIQALLVVYTKGAEGVSAYELKGPMVVEAILASVAAAYALWWVRGLQEPPPGSLGAYLGLTKPRSLWGWVWRSCVVFVVKFVAYLPALVLANQWAELPSDAEWPMLGLAMGPLLLGTLLAAWAVFCPDRLAWPRRCLQGLGKAPATAPMGPTDIATRPAELVQEARA